MNQKVEVKVKERDKEEKNLYLLTSEALTENLKAIIHQQNYNITYLQEIGMELEEQFRELNFKLSHLQNGKNES